MTNPPVHGRITGPIVMIGFGSIGKGMLPLIERHFEFDKQPPRGHRPERQGPAHARRARHPLRPHGPDAGELPRRPDAASHGRRRAGFLRQPLGRHLLARHHGTRAANSARSTSIRWPSPGPASTSTRARARRRAPTTRCARSSSTRAAAIRAARRRCPAAAPIPAWCRGSSSRRCSTSPRISASRMRSRRSREDWASLMSRVGVKGIHIAERDTQRATSEKPMGVFVNTWSVEGFVSEGLQPAELGWGTHEKWMPEKRRTHHDRLAGGDLPAPARRGHASALLDADRAGAARLIS